MKDDKLAGRAAVVEKVRKSQKHTGKHQQEENLEDERGRITLTSILQEQSVAT
jgi:hypothetical protein